MELGQDKDLTVDQELRNLQELINGRSTEELLSYNHHPVVSNNSVLRNRRCKILKSRFEQAIPIKVVIRKGVKIDLVVCRLVKDYLDMETVLRTLDTRFNFYYCDSFTKKNIIQSILNGNYKNHEIQKFFYYPVYYSNPKTENCMYPLSVREINELEANQITRSLEDPDDYSAMTKKTFKERIENTMNSGGHFLLMNGEGEMICVKKERLLKYLVILPAPGFLSHVQEGNKTTGI